MDNSTMSVMTKQSVATWGRPMNFNEPVPALCREVWTALAKNMLAAGRTGGLHGVEVAPNQWARDFSDQAAADEWSAMLLSLAARFDIPFISVMDVEYDLSVFAGKDRTRGVNRFNADGSKIS